MNFISKEALEGIRKQYPIGSRVELTKMSDPYNTVLVPGVRGTVIGVDDIGTIHVNWDCGSSLGVVYGEDACRKLEEVTITCYGETKIWDDRIDALHFYKQGVAASEGCERERYMRIVLQLMEGRKVCTDEEGL